MDRDEQREERIHNAIVVDAYGPEEQAIGWHTYLEEQLAFPFRARCVAERAISPLRIGEIVQVVGMPGEEECEREMFVQIRWRGRTLAVPLAQLQGIDADEPTAEAIADWHYWVEQGYEFG
ncbi:MAG TPA: calcium-binding protein [Dehalococcoidia bacterium]|nr:calcium-binding protein [Dehalococcoidia bacterium]